MMIKLNKFKMLTSRKKLRLPTSISLLSADSCVMNYEQRVAMTSSCRDTDYIPKVKNAGSVIKSNEHEELQVMHNGLMVKNGGYFGSWMSEIIFNLGGHHEPQEEKVFYEVLSRIHKPGAMIELGAFWSYYSMWYKSAFPKAHVVACEPDPINIEVGRHNAQLNNLDITFIQSAAGSENNKKISFHPDSSDYKGVVKTKIRTVDSIVKEYNIPSLSVLHVDVQGSEIKALNGAIKSIKSGIIRFVFVSTHHYSITDDYSTHIDCMDWIISHGGHVIAEHNVNESFSGDGLIVASFDSRDKDFLVPTSVNSSDRSLFRSYERDLVVLMKTYDSLTRKK